MMLKISNFRFIFADSWIFRAKVLVAEKCVWYDLALAVTWNSLAKCELASVNFEPWFTKEDIWSVPQCTMLLCYSGSTSHNAQCFYDNQDQFSQFSPHCRIHVHSSIILKDTVWIAEFSWFSSLFGIFKALLSLDNLNRQWKEQL